MNGVEDSWLAERLHGRYLCINKVCVCSVCVRQTLQPTTFWVVLERHCFTPQGTVPWPIQRVGWSWCQSIFASSWEWTFYARCLSDCERQRGRGFTALVSTGYVWLFVPVCLLINVCISSGVGIRLAFIETYHILRRMLVWEYGLHPSLIPGRSLNVLTETDSWVARPHPRLRRPCEMKQWFPHLLDLKNHLELMLNVWIPRLFQSSVSSLWNEGCRLALFFKHFKSIEVDGQAHWVGNLEPWVWFHLCHFLTQTLTSLFDTSRP